MDLFPVFKLLSAQKWWSLEAMKPGNKTLYIGAVVGVLLLFLIGLIVIYCTDSRPPVTTTGPTAATTAATGGRDDATGTTADTGAATTGEHNATASTATSGAANATASNKP